MKKLIFPIALLFLAVQLASCGGNSETPAENWLTFEQDNYSITYPESWTPDSTVSGEVAFSFLSPRRDVGDNMLDNVSLVISDLSSNGWGLDSFVNYMEGELPSMISDLKILENERKTDQAEAYHRLLYTGKYAGNEIKYEQRFWVLDGTGYTLAFSASTKDYDWYKEDADKMMNSFSIGGGEK